MNRHPYGCLVTAMPEIAKVTARPTVHITLIQAMRVPRKVGMC